MKIEMVSFIEEELEDLLKLKKGDPARLNRIRELCEGHKLIPISDRKYVERLASQYLHKEEKQKAESQKSETLLPAERHSKEEIIQKIDLEKEIPKQELEEDVKVYENSSLKKQPQHTETKFDLQSKNKIFIGLAAIAIALIVIVTVSFNGIEVPTVNQNPEIKTPPLTPPYITLETDQDTYEKADIISVSGKSNPIISGEIDARLENSAGKVIWNESIKVKNDGEFSTLLIAGGSGWEQSGTYVIIAKHNSLEGDTSFEFES